MVKGHDVAGEIKSETQVIAVWTFHHTSQNLSGHKIDFNQNALTGRAPGGTMRALVSQLRETVRGEDAGDGEQGGHPDQLCRGEEHSALEDPGRVRVPAGRQLPLPLPPDMASAPCHQEGGGGRQDRQRVLQPAQERPGRSGSV